MKKLISCLIGIGLIFSMTVTAIAAEPRAAAYKCPRCDTGTVAVHNEVKIVEVVESCPFGGGKSDIWTVKRVYEVGQCDSCSYSESSLISEDYIGGKCGNGIAHD